MRRSAHWLLVLCAMPSLLLGQTAGRVLKSGDRVRVIARADTGIYTVRAVSQDTLTVELPESQALAYFPVSTLRRVDVSRGREERATVAMRRSLFGLLGGAAVGGVFGLLSGDDPARVPNACTECVPSLSPMTRNEKAAVGAALSYAF